jgi:hypothetical protein
VIHGRPLIDLGLFAHYLRATAIRLPFSDMYSYVLRYLQYRQDGHLWWPANG